jgi:uncharacterized protein (TIGR00661 family)
LSKQKIIVAPLNWGLGHASRCVSIIELLLAQNFIPVIASDGKALLFLQQEFPELESIKLPSYYIKYGKFVKLNLLFQLPKIVKAIQKEKRIISRYIIDNKDVVGIISDNRFGVHNKKVFSVYITHQVKVLSGITTFFTSKIHQKFIKKFDECWVPDLSNSFFSGKLSSEQHKKIHFKYIGVLSRFKKETLPQTIDYLMLLSGPEPNRTQLEEKLVKEFSGIENVVFVLGKVENQQKQWTEKGITFYNYLLKADLQKIINSSKLVICRSGYSTIMDLAVLGKKAFFIPTQHQSEQEYLAKYLENKKIAPYCKEKHFTYKKLIKITSYKGLQAKETNLSIDLNGLFHRK